tara:strand:+ start:941 stop:2320 length:1380 start_codon:yes stop_codon:yes gene_type:complete
MIINDSLPFIKSYVASINQVLLDQKGAKQSMSSIQCYWLSFVILGLLVTNSLCWSRFERFALKEYSASAICWMFKKAKITWELLLYASVLKIIESYNIRHGVLVIDDTDVERSKNTKQIAKVHILRDKKTAGYLKGQNIIFLVLVTDQVTIPVGFEFYQPDPALSAWAKEDKRMRKNGVLKKYRPIKPNDNSVYPSKKDLGLKLVNDFASNFPSIKIKATVADAFYNTKNFFESVGSSTKQPQVISQIKTNQLINVGGKFQQVGKFFANFHGKTEVVTLRNSDKQITFCSAKFKVKSHDKKLYVIALKYGDESEYRYLIANDTTWRNIDVIKAYALRWLVEVFIQDWKSYEGWNKLAMQRGLEGSEQGLIISLLSDHALHFHEDQLTLYKNKEPAVTVGSLREKVMMESLTAFIEKIVTSPDPKQLFEEFATKIAEVFGQRSSIKHMRGVSFDQMRPMT